MINKLRDMLLLRYPSASKGIERGDVLYFDKSRGFWHEQTGYKDTLQFAKISYEIKTLA